MGRNLADDIETGSGVSLYIRDARGGISTILNQAWLRCTEAQLEKHKIWVNRLSISWKLQEKVT
jgi:hypothetical protein